MKLCILHKGEALHSPAAQLGQPCSVCWLNKVRTAADVLLRNLEGIEDAVAEIGPEFVKDLATLRRTLREKP